MIEDQPTQLPNLLNVSTSHPDTSFLSTIDTQSSYSSEDDS